MGLVSLIIYTMRLGDFLKNFVLYLIQNINNHNKEKICIANVY